MKKINNVLLFLMICGCFMMFGYKVEAATKYNVIYDCSQGYYGFKINNSVTYSQQVSPQEEVVITSLIPEGSGRSYWFQGWSTSYGGKVEYLPGEKTGKYLTKDLRLYPVYNTKTYEVTFKSGSTIYEVYQIGKDCFWDYSGNYTNFKTGYRLVGWSKIKDNTVEKAEYTNLTKVGGHYLFKEDSDVTLYPVFEPYNFSVTFNVDGTPYTTRTTKSGAALNISDIQPTKSGVRLIGWGTYSGDKEVDYINTYTGTCGTNNGSVNVFAIWGYKISFDLKANVSDLYNAPASVNITAGNSYTLPGKNMMRKDGGGNFAGWSLSPLSTTVNLSPGDSFKPEADITFYAVWDMNQYNITFDDNGGVYGPGYGTKTHAAAMTIPNVKPEREGYEFLGWATTASATTPTYKVGGSYTAEGDATLYAVWKKAASSNTNGNGGATTEDPTNDPTAPVKQTITAGNKEVAINSKSFKINAKTNGGGALTYKSSNSKIVKVGKTTGKVTIKGYGKATITITAAANGNYLAATKKITITVGPKKVSLKSVKSPKKKYLSVTWKKDTKASGYQIYFSTSKTFKSNTYKRNFGKKDTGMKVTGLKSKKTYYVKVRAYKTVKGKKYYGPWSAVKKVKVK